VAQGRGNSFAKWSARPRRSGGAGTGQFICEMECKAKAAVGFLTNIGDSEIRHDFHDDGFTVTGSHTIHQKLLILSRKIICLGSGQLQIISNTASYG
jgi:hypothetical protein